MFRVEGSSIAGVGVFASEPIPAGRRICLMEGQSCTTDEIIARIRAKTEVISDPLQVDASEFIDLDEVCRSFNHSCNPNAYIRGRNELVALREIGVDEEITFDYSCTMLYDQARFNAEGLEMWSCTCACGEDQCRGVIDEFRTLPEAQRVEYLAAGRVQDFILRVFGAGRG